MRLTVGPLPAAVYWRRRAIVLGVLLVAVLVLSYSLGGGTKPTNGAGPTPTASASGTAEPDPQVSAQATGEPESPAPQESPSPEVDPRMCTDAELKVTARPEKTSIPRGSDLVITILIKNTSKRTCLRDVGFDLQELYVVRGAEKVWSSDDCGAPRGNDLRSLPPGHERSYSTVWNGQESSACTKTLKAAPDGPVPPKGEYQVFGRVGTDHSEPVALKLT